MGVVGVFAVGFPSLEIVNSGAPESALFREFRTPQWISLPWVWPRIPGKLWAPTPSPWDGWAWKGPGSSSCSRLLREQGHLPLELGVALAGGSPAEIWARPTPGSPEPSLEPIPVPFVPPLPEWLPGR